MGTVNPPVGQEIIGDTFYGEFTLDNDTVAYSANDAFGSKFTLTNAIRGDGRTGRLDSLVMVDQESKQLGLILFIFKSSIAGTTNNAAFAPSGAELLTCVGKVEIATTDWVAAGANGMVCQKDNIGVTVNSSDENLYCQFKITSTPTFSGSSKVAGKLGILQD